MSKLLRGIIGGALIAGLGISSLSVVASEERPFEGEEVTIGVVGDSSERTWNHVAEVALEQEGIVVETVLFTDYNQPNVSLADGSIDINSFQHVAYLTNWNEENGEDLVHIGFTSVNRLSLFSDKHASIEDLPDGARIAIPNDPTNGGRALLALEIAGLIEVDDEAGILPEVSDITSNPKNLEIVELDASQTALSLPDVDAAFINVGYANDAGLDQDTAIFSDTDEPDQFNDAYRNVLAVRAEDEENPLYLKIVELYQTDEIAEILIDQSNGGSVAAWVSGDSEESEESEESADAEESSEESEEDAE